MKAGDILGRYGPDEFIMLLLRGELSGEVELEKAIVREEKLRQLVERTYDHFSQEHALGGDFLVTASAGLALKTAETRDETQLLQQPVIEGIAQTRSAAQLLKKLAGDNQAHHF